MDELKSIADGIKDKMDEFIKFLLFVSPKSFFITNEINTTIRERLYSGINLSDDGRCGGSPTVADLNFLTLLCNWINPINIIEVGTWIGTSAVAMSMAGSEKPNIYTCDRRRCITEKTLVDIPRINYYNMSSSQMLNKIKNEVWPVELCFIDANISDDDAVGICKLFKPGTVAVAIHDMNMHNGRDNMARFKAAIPNPIILLPQGTKENDRTGFICSWELMEK